MSSFLDKMNVTLILIKIIKKELKSNNFG
jgi:hypothetical protein